VGKLHSLWVLAARYAHVPDLALVAAADRVASRIASALDGNMGAESAAPVGPYYLYFVTPS
jgi:hypothetical protein